MASGVTTYAGVSNSPTGVANGAGVSNGAGIGGSANPGPQGITTSDGGVPITADDGTPITTSS